MTHKFFSSRSTEVHEEANVQYTAEQKAEFKRMFSSRRRRQIIVAIPVIVILASLAVIGESKYPDQGGFSLATVLPTLIMLVAAVLIFTFRNWRCPACDKYLGKAMNPKFCHKCGVALQ